MSARLVIKTESGKVMVDIKLDDGSTNTITLPDHLSLKSIQITPENQEKR